MFYSVPGVYVNEIQTIPNSVAQAATAVPAFIGAAGEAKGPVRISSMHEFYDAFGKNAGLASAIVKIDAATGALSFVNENGVADAAGLRPASWLSYCLEHYFMNGGGVCYVCSVADAANIDSDLEELAKQEDITMLVAGGDLTADATNYYTNIGKILGHCEKNKRFALLDVDAADVEAFRTGVGTESLSYGAAYYPDIATALNYQYSDNSVSVYIANPNQGSAETDPMYPAKDAGENVVVSLATLKHPTEKVDDGGTGERAMVDAPNALYNVQDYHRVRDFLDSQPVTLPPSPAMAGIICRKDRAIGPWAAPANISVVGVKDLTVKIGDTDQETLNIDASTGKSINALRYFEGRGNLVWGARTLDGNSNEWRYINVRRLFLKMENEIKRSTQYVIFEPNTARTWLALRAQIEAYLTDLWKQGALAGAKAEEAFFVRVGLGETMTEADILEGRMNVMIGAAAVRPAEFLILNFMHKLQQS